jgi:hypothetical protein
VANKTRVLHVKLTEDEYIAYSKFIDLKGETLSRFTRKLIREAINGEIDLLTDEQLLLKVGMRQLVSIANNLNQISKAMNAGIVPKVLDAKYLLKIQHCSLEVRKEFRYAILKTKQRWLKSHAS